MRYMGATLRAMSGHRRSCAGTSKGYWGGREGWKIVALVWALACTAGLRAAEAPRGFVVAASNAAALMARGKIAEGVDAQRVAMWYLTEQSATGAPVAVAQALHELGRGFMKLGRLADAEEALAAARRLAAHPRLEADWRWVRSCRANAVGDKRRVAEEARACIELAPDYHWAAYHDAAWAVYASGKRVEAVDLWLDGLRAFCDALPVEDAPAYLDAALCYWKSATDEQIIRYYEELGQVALANPVTSGNQAAVARLLAERHKLATLFPKWFTTGGWQKLVADAAALGPRPPAMADAWVAHTNAVYAVDQCLYVTGQWETLINRALEAEVRDDHETAGRIYEFIVSPSGAPPSCVEEVQGYRPRYWANAHLAFFAAELEDEGAVHRERALRHGREALSIVASNEAGRGIGYCAEEFYRLLMSLGGLEKRAGNPWRCVEMWSWAAAVAPQSLDPQQCLLKHEADVASMDGDREKMARVMKDFFRLPLERPWYKYWHEQAYLYWQLADKGMWHEQESATRRALDTMLDGFELGIFDFACHWHAFCNATFTRLEELDLFRDLMWHERKEEYTAEQYERLYRLLGRFGLSVPARMSELTTLADVLRWRKHFRAVERERDVLLRVVCDTRAWRHAARPGVWFDFRSSAVELLPPEQPVSAAGVTNYEWVCEVTAPAHAYVFRYRCSADIGKIAAEPMDAASHQVFVVANDEGEMMLRCTAEREHAVRVRFVCDARGTDTTNAVWIVGGGAALGDWTSNKVGMYDDGTHGDEAAGDNCWTYEAVYGPEVKVVEYKYTRGGEEGSWASEEFPLTKRRVELRSEEKDVVEARGQFGE